MPTICTELRGVYFFNFQLMSVIVALCFTLAFCSSAVSQTPSLGFLGPHWLRSHSYASWKHFFSPKGSFSSLVLLTCWAGYSFVVGGHPVGCRVFSGIPGLIPYCENQKCLQTGQLSPGDTITLIEKQWLKAYIVSSICFLSSKSLLEHLVSWILPPCGFLIALIPLLLF